MRDEDVKLLRQVIDVLPWCEDAWAWDQVKPAHAALDRLLAESEIAWAAGLFEGEGTITSGKSNKSEEKRHLRLGLASTDEDVVRRFCAAVGVGSVCGPYVYVEGRKPHWQWHAACRKAEVALELLLPHLGARRQAKAEEVRLLVRR